MKVLTISDLHLNLIQNDHGKSFVKNLKTKDIDVVSIAGDLSAGKFLSKALEWFCKHFPNAKILYVKGNHDNEGYDQLTINNFIIDAQKQFSNLIWLENQTALINGQRFIGCTLWYPPTMTALMNKSHWSDFKNIKDASNLIFKWNQESVEFLTRNVQKNDFVITHMLPSRKSIAPRWQFSLSNCFFVCDMERVMINNRPKIWHHGHTHDSFDYMFDETRVVCNPLGNPSWVNPFEPNPYFVADKVVDI